MALPPPKIGQKIPSIVQHSGTSIYRKKIDTQKVCMTDTENVALPNQTQSGAEGSGLRGVRGAYLK